MSPWSKVDRFAASGYALTYAGIACASRIQNISGPNMKKSCIDDNQTCCVDASSLVVVFSRGIRKIDSSVLVLFHVPVLSVFLCSTPYALLPRANDTCLFSVVSPSRFQ